MLLCAILDDYQDVATTIADWRPLSGKVAVHAYTNHFFDREALVSALVEFDIIIAKRERTAFQSWLFERLPKLKLLVTTAPRNASIDLASAARHGVTVCGTRASLGSTCELTWGLILSLMRDIPQEVSRFREGGKWQVSLGRGLYGKTLGIVGLGKLGAGVARVAVAFVVNVSGWSRSLTPERCAEFGIGRAGSLDDLLCTSDIITLHLPLNAQSRGLIDARRLGLIRPHAILVNTSHGPIVDEGSLINALRQRRIAGAGIDVYDQEPLPLDHPYRHLDNVIATPHLGYVTEQSYRVYYNDAIDAIRAWLDGSPVRLLQSER